ncbi:MAG TPA: sulfotransferase, partial [Polymorphobacter sp.]|nr:sulfotransferase [Polymorphobacter sp.]
EDVKRERAHGDGMLVGLDSPEAFEEMLWHAFAPERYSGAELKVWPDTLPTEQRERLAGHMLQIAELRRPGAAATTRYASKNNLNIVRIGLLAKAFPDADIVVPFREPVQHAASLLRQHENFLGVHARDDFTRSYMAGVGHFDFGTNLKPVDFDGWRATSPHRDPQTLDFWLAYWIAAYTHLLDQHGNSIILVGHEALCANPAQVMAALAARLRLTDPAGFVASGADIRDSTARPVPTAGVDTALLAAATALHQRLLAAALK